MPLDQRFRIEFRGDIAIIVGSVPAGLLTAEARQELATAVANVFATPGVQGLVLAAEGADFIGDIDIAEAGREAQPAIADLTAAIAALPFPVVAALGGKAIGAGLELALAATCRIAGPLAQLGYGRSSLGAPIGGGAITRAAGLAGAEAALRLITAPGAMAASSAWNRGLIDAFSSNGLVDEAVALLGARPVRTPVSLRAEDVVALSPIVEEIARKGRTPLPRMVLEVLSEVARHGGAAGLAAERRIASDATRDPVVVAMRHISLAEREAARPKGPVATARPRKIETVGIVGAGTMGSGIAMAFAKAGFQVVITEQLADNLERGLQTIATLHARSVKRGSMSSDEAVRQRGRIRGALSLDALGDADLIIEAAFEDMAVKTSIFAALDKVCRPGAILATNTSYLDVNKIAAATGRPADVVGMHFFSPANVMSLLEVIQGAATAPDVLATVLAVAQAIGKQPVVVNVGYGFVGNRMLTSRNAAVSSLVLAGASPQQVDKAFRDIGWPMGPCQTADLAGLDVMWRVRQGAGRVDPLLDRLYERGRYGQKTGKGWYRYGPDLVAQHDPETDALIQDLATELGITRRTVTDAEIIEQTHGPMIAEGRAILAEGIATCSGDIDVIYVHGYGFPRTLGGPMYWAEQRAIQPLELIDAD